MGKTLRKSWLLFIFIFLLSLMTVGAQSNNLLTNPGFEDPYISIGGTPPQQVANGWNTWFVPAEPGAPNYENTEPEYYEAVDADRIRSGNNAQRYESFFATHTGGLFQVVSGVPNGSELTFNAHIYVWSSSLDDESVSAEDGDVIVQVGIDPTGGADGTSDDIIWSVGTEQYDAYNQYSVSAIAESSTVSVWIRSRVGFPVKTSRVYVDDASLISTGGGVVITSTPTATARPTTIGGVPSPTPDDVIVITSTPLPTATPTSGTGGPIPGQFPSTISYTVQAGDTVTRIADRYNSTVNAIQQANGLGNTSLIFIGQQLVVPVPTTPATPQPTPTSIVIIVTATPVTGTGGPILVPGTYRIQPGDTLSALSRRFNTTIAALAQLNGIVNPNSILYGQVIRIPTGTGGPVIVPQTPVPPQQSIYIVQPGDTLYRLSLRFNVSLASLIRANNIVNVDRIYSGQRLIIP